MNALLDSAICLQLVITLGHFVWQGLAVGGLAWLAGLALRRCSSSARYRLYLAALLVMAACPVATFLWLNHEPTVEATAERLPLAGIESAESFPRPASAAAEKTAVAVDRATPIAAAASEERFDLSLAPAPSESSRIDWRRFAPSLTAAYLAGVLAMLVRLALGLRGGRQLRRRSEPVADRALLEMLTGRAVELGLRSVPVLAWCREIAVPTVVGVLRPTILLPMSLTTGMTPDQLAAIFTHELAHIRRWDPLVNVFQRVVEAVLFFHPLVWFVSRRIRQERENCCDDLVLATGTDPVGYASSLLDIAERAATQRQQAIPALASLRADGRASELGGRIRRLLGAEDHKAIRLHRPELVLTVGVALLALAGLSRLAVNAEDEPLPDETQTTAAEPGESREPWRLDGLKPTPESIAVKLKAERDEFVLGESVVFDYEMTNVGKELAPYERGAFYPTLRINDGFRMSAVKLDVNDQPFGEAVMNWPMPDDFGGAVGGFSLEPNESHSTTLFVTRYLRFLEPGRYRLRIENRARISDAGAVGPYSAGETVFTLRQPTPDEARQVFERMRQAPRKVFDDNAMNFIRGAADFEAMHQPVYLPVLEEFARQGDLDALSALQRMQSLSANEVLVATAARALDGDDWQTARACYQHLQPSLPYPNWFDEPLSDHDQAHRERVNRTWKVEFGPVLTRLAGRLGVEVTAKMQKRANRPLDADAKDPEFLDHFRRGTFPQDHPQTLLRDIDFIYKCVGRPEDFADCLTAYAQSIELTKTLPLETHQYFRPRGSAYGFRHTVFRMLQRGAKPPTRPMHPGEAAALAIALRQETGFRPEGWQDEVMRWLKHDTPYLAELILEQLPEPIPNEALEYLPIALGHDYIDLQIAACRIAEKHPRAAYQEPLKAILESAQDQYLRKYAVDAARANGLSARYDPDAPFVDSTVDKKEIPPGTEQNAADGEASDADGASSAVAPPDEPPSNRDEFAEAIATRVAGHLPFQSEAHRQQTAAEFRELVPKYGPEQRTPEFVRTILDALGQHLQREFPEGPKVDDPVRRDQRHVALPSSVRMLQWRLFMALQRQPLDEGQQARLAEQNAWFRDYIQSLPKPPEGHVRRHAEALADFQAKIDDPLSPMFKEPLSDAQFAACQDLIRKQAKDHGDIAVVFKSSAAI